MQIKSLHPWNLSPAEAIALQKELMTTINTRTKMIEHLRYIGGVDCAFTKDGLSIIAGLVVWDRISQSICENYYKATPVNFPYIPGLLSFRELPGILEVLKLCKKPLDAIIVDGHGIAHPRRLGIASHLGLFINIPTIGCAKKKLVGIYIEPAKERGAKQPLYDKNERIGTILRTRTGVKPLFISSGNHIDLECAENIVLECGLGYRLPEPTRLADKGVAQYKKGS